MLLFVKASFNKLDKDETVRFLHIKAGKNQVQNNFGESCNNSTYNHKLYFPSLQSFVRL